MELEVKTSSPYKIIIERGCIGRIGGRAGEIFSSKSKAAVIADSNVFPLYAEKIAGCLEKSGFKTFLYKFPAGEENKRLAEITKMYSFLAENSFTRSDFIVAVGGGVTGDMAGFAAATYLRGIKFIQVPTSLLAQIDSSVGGKTGVDLPEGKNLVGAFHQPSLVLIDPDTLSTLPELFISDGMGEAVKYGCIAGGGLFEKFENGIVKEDIENIIFNCVDIKRDIVEKDEFESGCRMLLNFGHTFGHALEKIHGYRGLTHGAAVGIGMVMMAKCGEAAGLTEKGTAGRIQSVLAKYGLPVCDSADIEKIAETTASDKKNRGDRINLVMLKKIGESFIYTVGRKDVIKLLRAAQ